MMLAQLEALYRRLLYAIGRGEVTLVNDAGAAQTMQVRRGSAGVQDNVPRLVEYGFQSVPPVGSDAVVLSLAGNTSDAVVIATGNKQYRLHGLADGEGAISDDKGQRVHLTGTGIHIVAVGTRTIDATAVQINGDTTFNGTVTANGHAIDDTHRHGGVSVGASNTGTPV